MGVLKGFPRGMPYRTTKGRLRAAYGLWRVVFLSAPQGTHGGFVVFSDKSYKNHRQTKRTPKKNPQGFPGCF